MYVMKGKIWDNKKSLMESHNKQFRRVNRTRAPKYAGFPSFFLSCAWPSRIRFALHQPGSPPTLFHFSSLPLLLAFYLSNINLVVKKLLSPLDPWNTPTTQNKRHFLIYNLVCVGRACEHQDLRKRRAFLLEALVGNCSEYLVGM